MIRRRDFIALAAPLAAAAAGPSGAQSGRTGSVVVAYPPGGSTDILGRLFTEAFSQGGDKYIVENKPGANGTLGAAYVGNAAPDGRTLLYAYGNLLLNQEFMMKDTRFRTLEALTPVARVCVIQAVMVAAANHPAKDLREFIAMAKKEPGKRSYGYYGDLAVPSMAGEAGIELLRIPYKGGLPGMIDVSTGQVDLIYSSLAQAQPMLRSGKLKALAVSGDQRLPEWPNVPTVKEVLPNYRAVDYQVLMAPRNLPRPVLDALVQRTNAVLANGDLQKAFLERGAVIAPLSPDEVRAFMEADRTGIGNAVKAAGIQPE